MKPLSFLFFLSCIFFSCRSKSGEGSVSRHAGGLIPYTQRYPGEAERDTVFPGGVYLRYMVHADTLDKILYILYGKPGFDSVYVQKDNDLFNCNWEYAYHTSRTIGMMYECEGGRRLLLLPLQATGSVRDYNPLLVSADDSLLLVEDVHAAQEPVAGLLAGDLDMQQYKAFRLPYKLPCPDMLACFDTIYFNRKLIMEYETAEGEGTVTRTQEEKLDWKK